MKTEKKFENKKNHVHMVPKFFVDEKNKVVVCEMTAYLQTGRTSTIAAPILYNAMSKKLKFIKPVIKNHRFGQALVDSCFVTKGIAMCNPEDTFDEKKGKMIAEARAKATAFKLARVSWRVALNYVNTELLKITKVLDNIDSVIEKEVTHKEELVK